jgi:hypothetical protein
MINEEEEYISTLKLIVKWSKHWVTPSARSKYSGAGEMKEPAQRTLDFIAKLDGVSSYKERLDRLYVFLSEREQEEKQSQLMGTDFYFNLMSQIRTAFKQVEIGEPVQRNINR